MYIHIPPRFGFVFFLWSVILAVQAAIISHTCLIIIIIKKGNDFIRALGRGGYAFAARVSLGTFTNKCTHHAHDRRTSNITYAKVGGKCHLPTGDEKKRERKKKVCTFSAGHRGRRWHRELTGAYITVCITVRSFFHMKFLILVI